MADYKVMVPKLGESVQEGTITKIFVKIGDIVKEDDPLFELATDKVDSEIPSPVPGKIKEILCTENETYPVGQVVMVISIGEEKQKNPEQREGIKIETEYSKNLSKEILTPDNMSEQSKTFESVRSESFSSGGKQVTERFYSPLVKSIAAKEGISSDELDTIKGSGLGGRVQKNDITAYVEQRKNLEKAGYSQPKEEDSETSYDLQPDKSKASVSIGAEDTVVQMDRVRKLISNHMVMSKQISAHVTTVVEADVTNIALWRNKAKDLYLANYGEKLTYLPIFTEAVAKALSEFKKVNVSVDGDSIVIHHHINIGIAVAKDDGNLIVPVIRDADTKNLLGLTKEINHLSDSARSNTLNPDQLQDGTFTITNFGSFGNLMGTPIINQPQVAILAVGLVEKKPSVIETPTGDAIIVRHKMFLSLSYDHRVIDGMLGGKFLRHIADLLEQFDIKREI
jgi:2-oxoglutarate dehydrogenase E2 component (dihydrolipoamide succinyltransferase)